MQVIPADLLVRNMNGDRVDTKLAALRSSLANSLTDADFEDCCVLTEFSKSELDEVNEFIWTGKCQISLAANVFSALGIDLHSLSEPFPLKFVTPKVKVDNDPDVKYEVKEENLSDGGDMGGGDIWNDHLDEDMHRACKGPHSLLLGPHHLDEH